MTTNYQRVQRKLIGLVDGASFYPISTDPETGLCTVDEATVISPASRVADEVASSFEVYGGMAQLHREDWQWTLMLEFREHACLEAFDASLQGGEILCPPDDASGLPGFRLRMFGCEVTHPPHQSPNNGTRATYHFVAKVGRV